MARQELDVHIGEQAVPVGTLIFESDGHTADINVSISQLLARKSKGVLI